MESVNRFNHAHSQAPWRVQRQWVSVFLLTVLGFGMIATLYLTVTSQAAIIGREIQDLRLEIIETEHKNADLQTELALLTSKDDYGKTGICTRVPPGRARRVGISICARVCSTEWGGTGHRA